ncbi:MAG: hypothetical protein GF398_13905 [Chitinivibrionales bacterium]|nr:hypothetical protein [Chitinivibrionales bacterium]
MRLRNCIYVLTAFLTILSFSADAASWFFGRKKKDKEEEKIENVEAVEFEERKDIQLTYLDTLNRGNEIRLTESDFVEIVSEELAKVGPDEKKKNLIDGFRIQCFATSQVERARAEKKNLEMRTRHSVYISYNAPYYKLFVGDFKHKANAQKELNALREEGYPDAWIVSTKVFAE